MKSKCQSKWLLTVVYGLALVIACDAMAEKLDKIVAIVNSDLITQKELQNKVVQLQRMDSQYNLSTTTLRQKALDLLIDNSLQLQQASAHGITVSDSELTKILGNIARTHGITVKQLKEEVPKRENVSFQEFCNNLRQEIILMRMQHYVIGKDISVSPKEVDAVLRNPQALSAEMPQVTSYHVLDVLVAVANENSTQLKQKAQDAARQTAIRLENGEDVDLVIQDVQSKFKNLNIHKDNLGWRSVSELPDLFAPKIIKVKTKQVVWPIEAPNGIHILKLLGRKTVAASPQSGVAGGNMQQELKLTRDQAAEVVFRRKLASKMKVWLEERRKQVYIKKIT